MGVIIISNDVSIVESQIEISITQELINTLLFDKEPLIRCIAAQSLGNIGKEEVVEPLIHTMLHDRVLSVRVMSYNSLLALRENKNLSKVDEKLLNWMEKEGSKDFLCSQKEERWWKKHGGGVLAALIGVIGSIVVVILNLVFNS